MEVFFLLTVSCQLRGVRGADLRDDEDPKEHCTHNQTKAQKVHVKLLLLLVPTCIPMVKVTES
jgi:hypothetical protein